MIRRHPVTYPLRAKVIELRSAPICARHQAILRAIEEADLLLFAAVTISDVLKHRPMPPEEAAAFLDRNRQILQDTAEEAVQDMLKDCIESDEDLE